MPTHEIFTIPELLTLILAHLPPSHLITQATLVNHTWHNLIITHTTQSSFYNLRKFNWHPLLLSAFPFIFYETSNDDIIFPLQSYYPVSSLCNLPWHSAPSSVLKNAFERKEASWRGLLVTDRECILKIERKMWDAPNLNDLSRKVWCN